MARFPASLCCNLLAAALWAQQPAPSSAKPSYHAKSSAIEPGSISGTIGDGVYRNPVFGFSYKLPYGWVDRTREMQDDSPNPSNPGGSLLLLAAFERPPEADSNTLNSAIVIAAERLSNYSGMKTAADYFGPLTELAIAKGFEALEEPHQFAIGSTQVVRGDFSKARGTATVRQTSLVILEKGYEVSFTFIGESEDEVNELIEKLGFGAKRAAH